MSQICQNFACGRLTNFTCQKTNHALEKSAPVDLKSLHNVTPVMNGLQFCKHVVFDGHSVPCQLQPRRPGSRKSGREKRWRKFSRMGERASALLLLTSQFHDSFECLSLIAFFAHEKVFAQNAQSLPGILTGQSCIRTMMWS